MLKETEDNEWMSLELLTISCISVLMPLKKLLAYTPNFCMQGKTSRLPTSYPAHFFATRKKKIITKVFSKNAHCERRAVEEVFYVKRGSLITAFILKIGVKNILKIYLLQVAVFNCDFVSIYELHVSDAEN